MFSAVVDGRWRWLATCVGCLGVILVCPVRNEQFPALVLPQVGLPRPGAWRVFVDLLRHQRPRGVYPPLRVAVAHLYAAPGEAAEYKNKLTVDKNHGGMGGGGRGGSVTHVLFCMPFVVRPTH